MKIDNQEKSMLKELSHIDRLKQRGAKPMDPKKKQSYLDAVQTRVIPAIALAQEHQRVLKHNLRVRPIPLPKKGK
jgi:hypothetical protein